MKESLESEWEICVVVLFVYVGIGASPLCAIWPYRVVFDPSCSTLYKALKGLPYTALNKAPKGL